MVYGDVECGSKAHPVRIKALWLKHARVILIPVSINLTYSEIIYSADVHFLSLSALVTSGAGVCYITLRRVVMLILYSV